MSQITVALEISIAKGSPPGRDYPDDFCFYGKNRDYENQVIPMLMPHVSGICGLAHIIVRYSIDSFILRFYWDIITLHGHNSFGDNQIRVVGKNVLFLDMAHAWTEKWKILEKTVLYFERVYYGDKDKTTTERKFDASTFIINDSISEFSVTNF